MKLAMSMFATREHYLEAKCKQQEAALAELAKYFTGCEAVRCDEWLDKGIFMPKCKCEHWQICPMCAPHFFDADGKRKPPELTPLQECRAALDALRQAAKEAAEHLRHEAAELKRAHTISGEWDGTEPEAMAECKRLIALADRLQANGQGKPPAVGGSA